MSNKTEVDQSDVGYYDPEIVFEKNGEWFFYDETWSFAEGPFPSKEVCEKALEAYAEKLSEDNCSDDCCVP